MFDTVDELEEEEEEGEGEATVNPSAETPATTSSDKEGLVPGSAAGETSQNLKSVHSNDANTTTPSDDGTMGPPTDVEIKDKEKLDDSK